MGNSSYNKVSDFGRYAHLIHLGFGRTIRFRGSNGDPPHPTLPIPQAGSGR